MRPFNVLILAAGKGTRLAPLTDRVPKPLIDLGTKPMLKRVADQVKKAGAQSVFINAFHLGEQIVNWASNQGPDFKVHVEKELLGTGTPLYNVFLENQENDLLVLNGDVLQNLDIELFVKSSQQSISEVSLLCREFEPVNTVLFNDNKLQGIKGRFGKDEATDQATFTGISYYKKEALKEIGNHCFDIREFWKTKLTEDKGIAVFKQDNPELIWIDMGTPEGFYNSHLWLLDNEADFSMVKTPQNNIIPASYTAENVDSKISNSIILNEVESFEADSSQIKSSQSQIIGKDFVWTL